MSALPNALNSLYASTFHTVLDWAKLTSTALLGQTFVTGQKIELIGVTLIDSYFNESVMKTLVRYIVDC